jgi:WD40 repeat protein
MKTGRSKEWDLATSKEWAILKGRSEKVTTVMFSPDGKVLVSSSSNAVTERRL